MRKDPTYIANHTSRARANVSLQDADHHKGYVMRLQESSTRQQLTGEGFFIAEDVPKLGYASSDGTDRAFKERHCMDKLLVVAF